MGKSVNKVIILGRIGKDPEFKSTANSSVANFSIATDNSFKDSSGEWKKTTEWISCVAWGKLADIVKEYVSKGSQIYVEGRIQTRSWDDRESGQKKYKTEVLVSEVCLLSGGKDTEQSKQSPYERPIDPISEEDIPF